jgi:DNA-binding NarL/FixJ family response regulator
VRGSFLPCSTTGARRGVRGESAIIDGEDVSDSNVSTARAAGGANAQRRRHAPLSEILTTLHSLAHPDMVWLQQVLSVLQPSLDQGLGVYGYFLDSTRLDAFDGQFCFLDCSDELQWSMRNLMPAFLKLVPPGVLHGYPGGTLDEALREFEWPRHLQPFLKEDPRARTVGINAFEPSGPGVLLKAALPKDATPDRRVSSRMQRLSAHVASAYRLRRALCENRSSLLSVAAVIFDERGRTQHVSCSQQQHQRIRAQTARAEYALRSADLDEGLKLWCGLVAGEWTIVEVTDTDNKRFAVACRNPPQVWQDHRLTEAELQAVTYACLGHRHKLIAYELGLSRSFVTELLKSATSKLGATSLIDVVQLARRLYRPELVRGRLRG